LNAVYTFDRDSLTVVSGGPIAAKTEAKKKTTDAKLFWNGRSQAVRLPKEFRFEGDRVR